MAFIFDKQGSVIVMKCIGPLDLNNSQTLKDALLVGMENADNLVVNCESVDEIDSQCIQIFCTAHRMAVRADKKLILTGIAPALNPSPREIGDLCLSRSSIGCNKTCIWVSTEQSTHSCNL